MSNLSISLKELVSYDHTLPGAPFCVKQNKDELKAISSWRFKTELEALLAASLWLNISIEKQNINEFRFTFKHTLLILGVTESNYLT